MGGADITTKIIGASGIAAPIWCHRAYTPGGPVLPVMIAGDILVYWKAANLTSVFFTPIFTPTHPNTTRLRPTRPDEISPETRVPRASSDIIRHPKTH